MTDEDLLKIKKRHNKTTFQSGMLHPQDATSAHFDRGMLINEVYKLKKLLLAEHQS